MRTIVQKPDVAYSGSTITGFLTQYFDEVGQPLHKIESLLEPDDVSGSQKVWTTVVVRNSDGQVTTIHSPANITTGFSTSTTDGLVTTFTRETTGDTTGFVLDTKHQEGTSGSAYLDGTLTWTTRTLTAGDFGITRPLVASRRVYTQEITSGTTGSHLTSFSHTYYENTTTTDVQYIALKQRTTTNPAVSASNNGSGSSTTTKRYLRLDGSTAFSESAGGIFKYTKFTDGQLTMRVDDVDLTNGDVNGTADDPSGVWSITEVSGGIHRKTIYAYDDQGRSDTVTQPDGRVLKRYYSILDDGRSVTLAYADVEATPKFHGPVQYTVANHAGRAEVQATVALTGNESTSALTAHVDEGDDDPITAMDLGTVARLSVSVFDESGTVLEESRAYFDVPGAGDGTEGTHYDATFFGYDDQGRRMRTKAPHGTITRTDFDTLGRVVSQWIGTNDVGFEDGESAGTNNMVKTLANEYDGGSDGGNGHLTTRTLYVQDSDTDKRDTIFVHDVQGRVLLQYVHDAPPYTFNKFDNMGRLIASGQFSDDASISVGSDDPTTETADRMALSQTFYDEMGRVWKTQRHKIDDADGSDDDNLQSLTWYDADGRVIKVDGAQLTKTAYDRLGRQTHQFILAVAEDSMGSVETSYADADDTDDDIVLQERQTVYESTDGDDVVMTAVLDRFHDDFGASETTGPLDTNADGDDLLYTAANIEGRIQITAMWHDRFGRVIDRVRYGTNGGSSFDRDGLGAPTSPSDTELLTQTEYGTDGSILEIIDPRELTTRFEYDDAGRRTAVIRNDDGGSPSGDANQTIRYEYTDGLRTKYIADLPATETDQQTLYTYGTTKGVSAGDSKIATGHLLQKVQYPDSAGGTDVVTFAYNAQSQQIWTKDQEGNVIETGFDDSGREIHRRITTLDADFDGAVRRISTTYDSLGRRSLVTQYDNATVGSGTVTDEVKFTWSDWGDLEVFEQDRDSAVGAGTPNDYQISYSHAKATDGRNTVRRSGMTLPDGSGLTFDYSSTSGRHDADASRVTKVWMGVTTLATYDYVGVGQVVGIDYPENQVMWLQYGSSGSYPDLDRFNRVTSSRWTKDLATDRDFYDIDITYDRNSNITAVVDNNLIDGSSNGIYDVKYEIDKLDRLTKAEQGDWNGSTLTNKQAEQIWEKLTQTGNWERVKLDLDGDSNYSDTGEYDDLRTHNDVNELTARNTDATGGNEFTLAYDAVGNLTDDGEHYEYVWDVFGRLREVLDTSDQSLVAEFRYSGLGHRIGWHYDVDGDGTVEATSDDPWFFFVYDETWRIVATYRDDDGDPKEQFVHHNAGLDGMGGSSYIDAVILRDKDADTAWETTSDGTLEERVYHCQNWRADVVALVDDAGELVEQVRYSAYGIPFGMFAGDVDSDGDVDGNDVTQVNTWTSGYDVRGDLDLDDDVDSRDETIATNNQSKDLGWGLLSYVGGRTSLAGYQLDPTFTAVTRMVHVRHRVLDADLGRCLTRDSRGVDVVALYRYESLKPVLAGDPFYDPDWWRPSPDYKPWPPPSFPPGFLPLPIPPLSPAPPPTPSPCDSPPSPPPNYPPSWAWCQANGYNCFEFWQPYEDCIDDAWDENEDCMSDCDSTWGDGTDEWCNCRNHCAAVYYGNLVGCVCHDLQSENC